MTYLIAFLLLAVGAHAAGEDEARYVKLLTNVTLAHAAQVQAILEQQQKQLTSKCPLGKVEADNLSVLVNPEFGLDGIPTHGAWAATYKVKACKQTLRRMTYFEATKNGINIEAGPPGATLADPRLAKDVWSSFQKAAIRQEPTCNPRNMLLKDTTVVEAPSAAAPYWREAWVGRVCGKEMGQIVSFYPTRAGTVFRMSLPDEPTPEKGVRPSYGVGQ